MSNWMADIVVIVFPVGNITIRSIVVYTVAGSCAANLWLTNDHVASMSSMAGTANPWVYTDRYKRPCCICALLSNGLSTFPAYLMSAGCMSVSLLLLIVCAHITELCSFITRYWLPVGSFFVVLGLSWYFWTVLGDMSHFSAIIAHRSLWLARALYIIHLSSCWKFPEGLEWSLHLKSILYIFFQLQRNCHDFVQGCISHCLCLCLYKSFQSWLQSIYKGVYGIIGC